MHTERYEFQGLEVPVETWGSASETLVFLPGLGCRPSHYRRSLERLSSRVRLVVPDLSFPTHGRLPADPDRYYELVRHIADRAAPDAVWAGHSFGGLLSLLHDGPSIACAPSVPARIGLPRMVLRAAQQQAYGYLGFEGWRGMKFSARIMVDFVGTAATRPRLLFPTVASLNVTPEAYPRRSPRGVVFLSRRDRLYRQRDYSGYFGDTLNGGVGDDVVSGETAGARPPGGLSIRTIRDSHDWPIHNPEGFERRIGGALEALRGQPGASPSPPG